VNELQIALAGAGVVFVGAVWGYNIWQERQHKKLAEKIFKGGQPDVLLKGQESDERAEPLGATADNERIEPGMAQAAPLEAEVEHSGLTAPPLTRCDDIADITLRIEFVDAVSAPALWAVQAAWSSQLTKPLVWLGYSEEAGDWRQLSAHDAGRYAHIAVSLQLADRQGAVSDGELSNFLDGVHRLAQQFAGLVELPVRHEVLAHARALDEFCASVDVQLGVNIVDAAGGVFAGTKLRGLAEAAGLALQDDGRFHAVDEGGMELFSLANLGTELFESESLKTLATHGVTFMLDVPHVAAGPAVFDRMVAAANQMAQALGGILVDGQRHPLNEQIIAGIRAKIGEIQQQMLAHQIQPGSQRALRLFS
jgi:hypothetical protein